MKYVVGDIHGEITKLKNLIQIILLEDKNPEYIFIGDYIDKGENAKATLDFLINLKNEFSCIFILGNHEYYWKDASNHESYLLKYGAKNTINSFGCKGILDTQKILLEDYASLFSSLVDYYITDSYCITHSGVPPELYFIDDLNGIESSSFLFNRFAFINKEVLFQNRYKIIFGHTAFFKPYIDPFKIGIDTAACYLYEQPLTAFCIERKMFFNSSKDIYALDSIGNNYCSNIVRNKPYQMYD